MQKLILTEPAVQHPLKQTPYHQWVSPEGEAWALFVRLEQGYLIRFQGLVDFTVSADAGAISARPAPGVSNDSLYYLYQNLVQPLVYSQHGRFVLHGSAVEVDDVALVFLAPTGGGKSTLAAHFAAQGHRFISDDSVVLTEQGGGDWVEPAYPAIRLWDDSIEALGLEERSIQPGGEYTRKFEIAVHGSMRFCDKPCPLRHIYLLGNEDIPEPRLSEVSGSDALLGLLRHSFLLAVGEKLVMADHFERAHGLVGSAVFHRLDFPRRYDVLPRVRELVLAHTLT